MTPESGKSHGSAIVARDLVKSYGSTDAVRGVSFEVRAGEVVGFLGPNGAGKTTTVRMISCFLPPTSGTAEVFGLDVRRRPRDVKALLGVCPQEDNLDPDFNVLRNLLVYARYFDIPADEARRRAHALLEDVSLADRAASSVDALSGGMKRRLVLARSLLNQPRVLILDEPTTGLDPQARHLIWSRVRSLRATGVTVLLTTHYMEEASQLCDRVVLVDHGRILLDGAPAEVIAREIGHTVIEAWNHTPEFLAAVHDLPGRAEEIGDRLFFYPEDADHAERLFESAFPHQERLLRRATLEDVFLKRTGRALRD